MITKPQPVINCIAVDDEPLALSLVEDNIRKVPFLNLVGKCARVSDAMEIMNSSPVDLIFLDIRMPDISGIQFLKSMKTRPMVIFITAYEHYALEGFELDVLDYLLKPVSFDRFLKAAHKAREYYGYTHAAGQPSQAVQECIFVKADYRVVRIALGDILYIEGLKDYIKIHAGGKPVLTLMSLKAMEEKLPPQQFMRVHKSYIVSLARIGSLTKNTVTIGGREIPVSDTYRDELFRAIGHEGGSR